MKSIYYVSIIINLLIFRHIANAEASSSSLSFITLIPNIISNGRFAQEYLINSNLKQTNTMPTINVDAVSTVNGSNCTQDIQLFLKDLAKRELWALKTIDAWGKYPSGIMQGNIYWIGSVFECGHHLRGFNNTVLEQPFPTRTCVISKGDSNKTQPIYGLCVPQSCTANDIVNYLNQNAIQIPFVKLSNNLTNDSIQCIDHRPYDPKAISTIILLVMIVFLISLATGMHAFYGRKNDLKMEEPIPTGYEPIASRTTTEHPDISARTAAIDASQSENSVHEQDESTPLILRPTRPIDSVAKGLIDCCSIIENYRTLKAENQPKNLACINCIRVLSLWWIILGHTFLYASYYSDNAVQIFNWSRQFWFQIISQAVFGIDSFFVLSGFLTAFAFLITKVENEKFSIVKFFLHHYVYRYIRYTIFYAVILLIYITLSPYFGQDGPIYPVDGTETSSCRQTWWRNLLYINNFFDMKDGCMPFTWYLAVNMQFHWIAPLFLLAVSWKWVLGMLVAVAFILVDIISTSVIVSKNNYDHGILTPFYSNWSNTTHNYMNDVYVKPWCRLAPYSVGLILGYIIYDQYRRAEALSWDSILPYRTSARYNQCKQIVAWAFALTVLGLCIFGTYGDYNGHSLTRSSRIAFLTLSPLGWAVALSIIIIIHSSDQKGFMNGILSNSIFESLGKLTYGAYLWHILVIFVNYFARDQPTHYSISNILFNCTIHIMISYTLSFVSFILIELPIIKISKFIFKRPALFS